MSDIRAHALRRTLHGFRGHLQPGQNFHLFAALIEGRLLAHHRLHAAHAGREFRVFDVQFSVDGELPGVTGGAPIVGSGDFRRAHGGQHGLGAQLVVVGLLAAGASYGAAFLAGCRELEQLAQRSGTRPVQGRAHRHLRCFQVEAPCPAPVLENHPQELIYFARDLLPDRFRRFFSWSVCDSSWAGRRRQIAVLVSTNPRLSSWNLRNSATSRSALRMAR